VSGAEVGHMESQSMISKIMHVHGAATVRVHERVSQNNTVRMVLHGMNNFFVCLSISVQTVREFVQQVFAYLPRLTGASSS
jgi:hypothetical protein